MCAELKFIIINYQNRQVSARFRTFLVFRVAYPSLSPFQNNENPLRPKKKGKAEERKKTVSKKSPKKKKGGF